MNFAFLSGSGGKDSCLALWRARQSGLDVRVMLTALDETGERSRSHGLPRRLIEAQAAELGLELRTISASWATYEQLFVEELEGLRKRGCDTGIFGDIDLDAHRDWEERVCRRAEMRAHLPLWKEPRSALVEEILRLGYRALVVCVDRRSLDESFCGVEYDRTFLARLPPGVDACGENGEFHTFVYAGPGFRRAIDVAVTGLESHVSPASLGAVPYCFARVEPSHRPR
jgi:uncharacterized protein (TIGR00290 family)